MIKGKLNVLYIFSQTNSKRVIITCQNKYYYK